MVVANRTVDNARRLAEAHGGLGVGLDELDDKLIEADIVVASTGSPLPLINPTNAKAAIEARRRRPMLMVDIAVPQDIDPAVREIEAVVLGGRLFKRKQLDKILRRIEKQAARAVRRSTDD